MPDQRNPDRLEELYQQLQAITLDLGHEVQTNPDRARVTELLGEQYVKFLEAVSHVATVAQIEGYVLVSVVNESIRLAAWAEDDEALPVIHKLGWLIREKMDDTFPDPERSRLREEPPAGHA